VHHGQQLGTTVFHGPPADSGTTVVHGTTVIHGTTGIQGTGEAAVDSTAANGAGTTAEVSGASDVSRMPFMRQFEQPATPAPSAVPPASDDASVHAVAPSGGGSRGRGDSVAFSSVGSSVGIASDLGRSGVGEERIEPFTSRGSNDEASESRERANSSQHARFDFSHLSVEEIDALLAQQQADFEKDVAKLRRQYEKRGRALRAERGKKLEETSSTSPTGIS